VNIIFSAYDFEDADAGADTNMLVTSAKGNQPSDVKYNFLMDVRDLCRGSLCILDQSVMGTCPTSSMF
jgi:hypothetical protein